MSVLQSSESEIRYMKRKNLGQEAKIIGNYYRDLIRSYGVDVTYNKLDTSVFENYNTIIDQNTLLQRAYGYNIMPEYSCSTKMISYVETEADIFLLNKYGLNPNTDINFYFDKTDFACALATKCGQYQEYKIEEKEIQCFVPDCTNEIRITQNNLTGKTISSYISADNFPYNLGLGYAETFKSDILEGRLSVELQSYQYDVEQTVVCHAYDFKDFKDIKFPANDDIYKSLQHKIKTKETLETLIMLTFTVKRINTGKISHDGKEIYKNLLSGKIHGGVLFYNLNKIGKYLEKIHPEIGDIITLDFPDEKNPEKYEITDCYDKSLQSDGISPLLHKYIWKCKARRYVNNYDVIDETESDIQTNEKKQFEMTIDEHIAKQISIYDNQEDEAYGGYNQQIIQNKYDSQSVDKLTTPSKFEYLEDGTAIDIIKFGCGSKLVTNGYDLLFINANNDAYKLTTIDHTLTVRDAVFEQNLRFLKATKDCIVFVNIEGTTFKLIENTVATEQENQLCLNSLFDVTLNPGTIQNTNGNSFYVFTGCRTLMWSTPTNLYCKLESSPGIYKLI